MATAITTAFEHWNTQQVLNGLTARPDTVIFAHIPDLDPEAEIDRNAGLPPITTIVYEHHIDQTGIVSSNAVAYSVVLDTNVGNFSFNYMGLLHKDSNTLCMVVHTLTQQKIKTIDGKQGNNITRTFLMQFDGAAESSQVNVSAETWQIDFSARLNSIDENLRLSNLDYYGEAAFISDGFKVTKDSDAYYINSGLGYVGGLRVKLDNALKVPIENKNIWLDVSHQGTITGRWNVVYAIRQANILDNYTDANGVNHYISKLAESNGTSINDCRLLSPVYLLNEAINHLNETKITLSDIPNATTTKKGIVQLSSLTDSLSESHATTPKALKEATETRLALTGGTMTGIIKIGPTVSRPIQFIDANNRNYAGIHTGSTAEIYQYVKKEGDITSGYTRLDPDGYFSISGNTNILPVGIPQPWPSAKLPTGWLKCNGAVFDKIKYPELATAYPNGVLPDLRGEFIRGLDDGRGIDTNRALLTAQSDAFQGHWHELTTGRNDSQNYHYQGSAAGHIGNGFLQNYSAGNGWVRDAATDSVNGTPRIAKETRPRNIAFIYIVRAA